MPQIWKKIKSTWTGSLIFSFSLLAIFLVLFYLSNLDLKKNISKSSIQEISSDLKSDQEIKNRLGSVNISSLDYDSWAKQNNLGEGVEKYDGDPDKDGSLNYWEYIQGTDPNNPDTDGDGFNDRQEVINGFDPDAFGNIRPAVEISIDKINIHAPMIWSKSENEKDIMKELENGAAHFAKTASPGQNGNMIVSGHSSNYIWAAGNYNHIFGKLDDLENGDIITVKTIQKNGRVITYYYSVNDKFITGPDDEAIFENTSGPILTLSTCWPLGTAFRRLIVKAELVK